MKKVRFFSVAVAVVMVLFVSVWAYTQTYNMITLNGIIATGQKTGETSKGSVKLNGPANSYITSVTVKGLIDVNQYCKPTTQCKVLLYNKNLVLIGSVVVPCGTSFSTASPPKTITLPAKTYLCNETYSLSGEVTLQNAAPSNLICGISYTSGSAIFNCDP